MPVVEKIHQLKEFRESGKLKFFSQLTVTIEYDGYSDKCRCSIIGSITYCYNETIPHTYRKVEAPHIWVVEKVSIDSVYKALYQFIVWLNNQNKNQ
jgi:hypothetical protein